MRFSLGRRTCGFAPWHVTPVVRSGRRTFGPPPPTFSHLLRATVFARESRRSTTAQSTAKNLNRCMGRPTRHIRNTSQTDFILQRVPTLCPRSLGLKLLANHAIFIAGDCGCQDHLKDKEGRENGITQAQVVCNTLALRLSLFLFFRDIARAIVDNGQRRQAHLSARAAIRKKLQSALH